MRRRQIVLENRCDQCCYFGLGSFSNNDGTTRTLRQAKDGTYSKTVYCQKIYRLFDKGTLHYLYPDPDDDVAFWELRQLEIIPIKDRDYVCDMNRNIAVENCWAELQASQCRKLKEEDEKIARRTTLIDTDEYGGTADPRFMHWYHRILYLKRHQASLRIHSLRRNELLGEGR